MKQRWGRPVHPVGNDRSPSGPLVLLWLTGWIGLGSLLGYAAITAIIVPVSVVDTQGPTSTPIPPQHDRGQVSESVAAEVADVPNGTAKAAPRLRPTLNGHHWLTTDLIRPGAMGIASVTESSDGSYAIEGAQSQGTDLLTIDGTLWEADGRELRFIGVIESQTTAGGDDAPCLRVGPMVFAAPEGQRFWRLIESKNPCGDYAEQIELYFDGP